MNLTRDEQRKVAALQKRADYLRERVEAWDHSRPGGASALNWLKGELGALDWVFGLLDEIDDDDLGDDDQGDEETRILG